MSDFEKYLTQGEPEQREKGYIWQTAIGLQDVDGLKPSDYLIESAKQNIEGNITIEEVKCRLDSYYKQKSVENFNGRIEEADKVSARIAEILSEKTFTFSPVEYINIHKRLFEDIYEFAGKIRDYNISKAEWVLNGESVLYASAHNLRDALEYDFREEKKISYKGLSSYETVKHIAEFISNIWQAHVFGEGNTRATAVFAIKYLRTLGFEVNDDVFAEKSYYFRNSLVRANYTNFKHNIYATNEYLDKFFRNLLLGEKNMLNSRELRVDNNTGNTSPNETI